MIQSIIFTIFLLVISNIVLAQPKKLPATAVPRSPSSSLVFKDKKSVTKYEQTALGTFSVSQYRSIRIAVKIEGRERNPPSTKAAIELRLRSAERTMKRQQELLDQGVISRTDFDLAKSEFDAAKAEHLRSLDQVFPALSVWGLEGDEEIFIMSFDESLDARSFILEEPPSKVTIKVFGKGNYSLYVWGH